MMYLKRLFLGCLGLLLPLSLAFAQPTEKSSVFVVATFPILADFTKKIGGERVNVISLVPPMGDVHVYQPSPKDAQQLVKADLIVVNGLGFEGWMERLLQASRTKARLVIASKGVSPLSDKEARRSYDPHAWQSVQNAKIYVANITDGLMAVDPAYAANYQANAEAYLRELEVLDLEVQATISSIPPYKRKIVTTHDAFEYFGKAYGLAFMAPQGVSTEGDVSARDVAKLIRQIKADRIPAIFVENIGDSRLLQQISQETGAQIGGTLYSDTLSPPDGPAASYIAMMRHNVKELQTALKPAP